LFVCQSGVQPVAHFIDANGGDVVIADDGKVGIGTFSPDETLHVEGNIRAANIKVNDKIIHRGDADTSINFTTDNIDFETANTIALTIDSSQQVGIGTTNPSSKLVVG
jgi:hypothetical protein